MATVQQQHGLVRACLQTAQVSEGSVPGTLVNTESAAHSGVTASGLRCGILWPQGGTLSFGFAKKNS